MEQDLHVYSIIFLCDQNECDQNEWTRNKKAKLHKNADAKYVDMILNEHITLEFCHQLRTLLYSCMTFFLLRNTKGDVEC